MRELPEAIADARKLAGERRFATPVPFRGPQKFASVSRDVVINAFGVVGAT